LSSGLQFSECEGMKLCMVKIKRRNNVYEEKCCMVDDIILFFASVACCCGKDIYRLLTIGCCNEDFCDSSFENNYILLSNISCLKSTHT
jgi:hypothetical protein